jgi:plasmid stabilization system protein ParE
VRVIWSDEALDELQRIRRYIAEHNPRAAANVAEAIMAAADLLSDYPEAGVRRPDGSRALTLSRYPYTVYYDAGPDRVEILTVRHGRRRRPG